MTSVPSFSSERSGDALSLIYIIRFAVRFWRISCSSAFDNLYLGWSRFKHDEDTSHSISLLVHYRLQSEISSVLFVEKQQKDRFSR